TRPILTKESPVCEAWRERYMSLKEGDISLNKFSPTGFYSSAVDNDFLRELKAQSDRQVPYTREPIDDHIEPLPIGARGRAVYLTKTEKKHAEQWIAEGFTEAMRTPDSTLIFVTPETAKSILADQQACMGCLSQCRFSNWADNDEGTTGKRADPRSFCIQKTLQSIAHGGDVEKNLMFAGHNAFQFARDPFYSNGFIPTVKELVERLISGD
ncbi:MAG: nitronate monooxygenase, partial [Rhodospirillales bacterium]|nr:nitronate monooxygenase [Rhodospirillales bacterium]